MLQVYGEMFEPGFEIVKNYRTEMFTVQGAAALHQELTSVMEDEQMRKDFIQICLKYLMVNGYDEVSDL